MISHRVRKEPCCHPHDPQEWTKTGRHCPPFGLTEPTTYASGMTSFLTVSGG
jgi:hypothetical protein